MYPYLVKTSVLISIAIDRNGNDYVFDRSWWKIWKKSLMKDYYVWKCRQGYWQWDAEYDEICVMRVWNDEILTLCGKIC